MYIPRQDNGQRTQTPETETAKGSEQTINISTINVYTKTRQWSKNANP